MHGTELALVQQAFESNYIAPLGPMVDAFELEFCELLDHGNALALCSGTAAMHLAMRLVGVGPGTTVLASTLTFIGSIASALYQGAELAFVDADRESWCMDSHVLAEALATCEREGRRVSAVVPTDLYGHPADMDPILALCRERGIPVLQDCAEAVGTTYKGRPVGLDADAAIFSFNGNKIITSSGGGMLCSANRDLIDRARNLSQQAREPKPYYEHKEWGYNYRMSNVLASIGLAQLRVLPVRVAARRRIFEAYRLGLDNVPGITFMPEAPWAGHNRWLTVIQIDVDKFGVDPETLRLHLETDDIETRPVWKPMHLQPVFRGSRCFGSTVAEQLFAGGLCLPSGSALTDSDIHRVIDRIRTFGECRR
jgi:dTDP-4-amino-4,6-dideoxygalactose transaminase